MQQQLCAKNSMLSGGVTQELLNKLVLYAKNDEWQCHSCSIMLIKRASEEMMKSAYRGDWNVASIKLYSLVMILNLGVLDVFKENLHLKDGKIICNEVDSMRFNQCCDK